MPKPLWKFLEDGGISACIEYGKMPIISSNSNCCSWATGDLLHYNFIGNSIVGQNNCFKNDDEISSGCLSFNFMNKYFTRNMLNNGLQFLGLGENIPQTDKNHYIVAVFHRNEQKSGAPDYHFIRQHNDGKWSHRNFEIEPVTQLFIDESPKSIFDFIQILGKYTMFKGWWAVPVEGIRNGLDFAIFQMINSISNEQKDDINYYYLDTMRNIKDIYEFYKQKELLMNDVTNFDRLDSAFYSLTRNAPKITSLRIIQLILMKHNLNRFPKIKNSPARDLNIGR